MTVIVERDAGSADAMQSAVGRSTTIVAGLEDMRRHLHHHPGEYAVVLGPSVDLAAAVALADTLRVTKPALGVILVRQRVDTTVLAEALRAGMREVIEERDLTGLNSAVARAYELHTVLTNPSDGSRQPESQGTLITVFSPKGGVGKTTVSTNLAAGLVEGGKRSVCIVDLDLAFGDVSIVLQLFPTHTIADTIGMTGTLDPAAVEAMLTEHSSGLKALVAPVQPDAKDSINGELVGRVLRILKSRFDVVVVDTPPAFDDVVLQAFDESDIVMLVGTLDVPSLKSLKVTTETLGLLNHPRDQWRLVLNRADLKVGLSSAEVEKTLDLKIAASIPQSRDVTASINQGKPIVLESPRHPVSQQIKRLGLESLSAEPSLEPVAVDPPAQTRDRRRGSSRARRRSTA